jgi:hypothetical protein
MIRSDEYESVHDDDHAHADVARHRSENEDGCVSFS